MAKEKKLYAIKEMNGLIWKTVLNVNEIDEICYEGAGTEMADVDLPTNTKVRIVVLKEEEEQK